jgi:hypothetical protein
MSGGGDDGASSANKSTSSHSGRGGGRIQPLFDESRVGQLQHDQEGRKAASVTPPSTPQRLRIIKTPENRGRLSSSSSSMRSSASTLPINNKEKLQMMSMLRESDKVVKPNFLDMVYNPFAQKEEDLLSTPNTATTVESTLAVSSPESSPIKKKKSISFKLNFPDEEGSELQKKLFALPLSIQDGDSKVSQQEQEEEKDSQSDFSKALTLYVHQWRRATEKAWSNRESVRQQGLPRMALVMASTANERSRDSSKAIIAPEAQSRKLAVAPVKAKLQPPPPPIVQEKVGRYTQAVKDANDEDSENEPTLSSEASERSQEEKSAFSLSLASYVHQWRHSTKLTWDKKEVIRQQGLPRGIFVVVASEADSLRLCTRR